MKNTILDKRIRGQMNKEQLLHKNPLKIYDFCLISIKAY